MSEVLIVQNISREGPGALAAVLNARELQYDVVDLSAGEVFPDPLDYEAVIVLGGPDSANDPTPKMATELAQVKVAIEAGKPYLGICLGLQVLVKAAGGRVVQNAVKEIGFLDDTDEQYTVAFTENGQTDPLFTGLSSPLSVFQLHGETVELTPAMTLLATAKDCHNQIVRVGEKAYGLQSHFELTSEMLEVWGAEDPDLQPIGLQTLRAHYAGIQASYDRIGAQLLNNFLDIAGLK